MGSDRVFEAKADIYKLVNFLRNLKGSKILTFEESTISQWLYVTPFEVSPKMTSSFWATAP